MAFEMDTELAEEVGKDYGDYVTTFISEHQQVRADLFRWGEQLVAHVSFPIAGIDGTNVTDKYVAILYDYAKEHGFEGRLRFIYVES